MGIRGDLIQYRQKALGFGQEAVVHIRLELQQGVVDSQAVKLGLALQQDEILLLPGKPFKDLLELSGRGIERVIKRSLMHFRAVLIAERFLAEIGNFLLNVQVRDREIFQIGGQVEDFLLQGRADFKRLGIRLFVKLADVESGFPLVADFDLDEFGRAALEDAAIGDGRAVRIRTGRRSKEPGARKKSQYL